jgi:hypothetical protein
MIPVSAKAREAWPAFPSEKTGKKNSVRGVMQSNPGLKNKGLGRINFCDKDLRLKIFYRLERRQKVILAHGARQSV